MGSTPKKSPHFPLIWDHARKNSMMQLPYSSYSVEKLYARQSSVFLQPFNQPGVA